MCMSEVREPMRCVLMRQASMVALPFTIFDVIYVCVLINKL